MKNRFQLWVQWGNQFRNNFSKIAYSLMSEDDLNSLYNEI